MSDIERLRQKMEDAKQPSSRTVSKWEPLDPSSLAHSRLLVFDQSLANTGYVFLENDYEGLKITRGGVLSPKTDLTSFEGTYNKAQKLSELVSRVMMTTPLPPDYVVMERPSVSGYRTESAMLSGYVIHSLTHQIMRMVPVKMVSNRTMRSLLLPPDDRKGKSPVKGVIEELIPPESRKTSHWNEHVVDAAALGVTYLSQLRSSRGNV